MVSVFVAFVGNMMRKVGANREHNKTNLYVFYAEAQPNFAKFTLQSYKEHRHLACEFFVKAQARRLCSL